MDRKRGAFFALALVLLWGACGVHGMAESQATVAFVDNGSDKSSKLNLRAEPSRESNSLGMFYSGVQVTVLSDAGGGWFKVSIGGEQSCVSGYMMGDYLSTDVEDVQDATFDMTVVSPYGTPSVVLRDCPSDSYHAIAVLEIGSTVRVLGTSGDFYYVKMADGTVGCLEDDELK